MSGTRAKVGTPLAGAGTMGPISQDEVRQTADKITVELKKKLLEQMRTDPEEALDTQHETPFVGGRPQDPYDGLGR